MTRHTRLSLGACAFAMLVFLGFLGRGTVSTSHELRVTQTAATMAAAGWPWAARPVRLSETGLVNPWLVPIFQGQVRLQKPPLPYWCTATMFRLVGISDAAARLIPALLGSISSVLMYRLSTRLIGQRAALVAAAIWCSCFFIVDEHRKAMADPYLAFFTLASLLAWVEASSRETGRTVRVVLFYGLLGCGAMAKGPVMLLHATLALGAFAWCFRRWPRVGWRVQVGGVALMLGIALPWPIVVALRIPGAVELWRFESIGEFADNQRNARPVWFYLPQMLFIALPWTPLAIAAAVGVVRRRRTRWFALLWLSGSVAVFSLSHMKKNAYLLPVMPAMVLLVAGEVSRLEASVRRRRGSDRLWQGTHVAIGIAMAVVVCIATIREKPGTNVIAGVCIAAALVVGASLILNRCVRRTRAWVLIQAMTFALLTLLFIAIPAAHREQRKASQPSPELPRMASVAQP